MFVEINHSKMQFSQCNSFSYVGMISDEKLRGMEMVFVSYSSSEDKQIEALLRKQGTITVTDPFAGGEYEAKVDRTWSSSHREGHTMKNYQFTIREVDKVKRYSSLQIEGEIFSVIKNIDETRNDGVVNHTLLRLSPEEFETFNELLKTGPIRILREGVDDEPVERRFGRVASWSRHEEDSQTYYKQMVSFVTLEPPTKGLDIPLGTEHRALSTMVVSLAVRFSTLLQTLEDKGIISGEEVATIKQDQWRELMDERRRISLRAQLRQVEDAEEEYSDYETD